MEKRKHLPNKSGAVFLELFPDEFEDEDDSDQLPNKSGVVFLDDFAPLRQEFENAEDIEHEKKLWKLRIRSQSPET